MAYGIGYNRGFPRRPHLGTVLKELTPGETYRRSKMGNGAYITTRFSPNGRYMVVPSHVERSPVNWVTRTEEEFALGGERRTENGNTS